MVKKMNPQHNDMKRSEVDAANFALEVLKSERPVLVAFTTQWSRPCHVLGSVLDEIASSHPEMLKVVWVNADENPDLGLWYDIQAVPTLLYFVAGNVRTKIVGTSTKAAILSKLQAVSNTAVDTKGRRRQEGNA
jgi:thioredoxin 1